MRFLIERTSGHNARDDAGRTALDWALTQGETESARVLREAGGKALAEPSAVPPAVEHPRDARAAVAKSSGHARFRRASHRMITGNAFRVTIRASRLSPQSWRATAVSPSTDPSVASGKRQLAAGTGPTEEFRMFGRDFSNLSNVCVRGAGAQATFATDAMVHQLAELQQRRRQLGGIRPAASTGGRHAPSNRAGDSRTIRVCAACDAVRGGCPDCSRTRFSY